LSCDCHPFQDPGGGGPEAHVSQHNTGSRGALFDTPIINQPQTGILGTGAVIDRVVPLRDPDSTWRISVRSMAYLSISYDHRIVDGADAARFLGAVKHRLETGFTHSDLP